MDGPCFLLSESGNKSITNRISLADARARIERVHPNKDPLQLAEINGSGSIEVGRNVFVVFLWPSIVDRRPNNTYQPFFRNSGGGGVTGGASTACYENGVNYHVLIQRHYDADWGDVSEALAAKNDKSLFGHPSATLRSCFKLRDGQMIAVVTRKKLAHGTTTFLVGEMEKYASLYEKYKDEQKAEWQRLYEWRREWSMA